MNEEQRRAWKLLFGLVAARELTAAKRAEIYVLYKQGWSIQQLAKRYRFSETIIEQCLEARCSNSRHA